MRTYGYEVLVSALSLRQVNINVQLCGEGRWRCTAHKLKMLQTSAIATNAKLCKRHALSVDGAAHSSFAIHSGIYGQDKSCVADALRLTWFAASLVSLYGGCFLPLLLRRL